MAMFLARPRPRGDVAPTSFMSFMSVCHSVRQPAGFSSDGWIWFHKLALPAGLCA